MSGLSENEFQLIITCGYDKIKAYRIGGETGEIFFNAQKYCCCGY